MSPLIMYYIKSDTAFLVDVLYAVGWTCWMRCTLDVLDVLYAGRAGRTVHWTCWTRCTLDVLDALYAGRSVRCTRCTRCMLDAVCWTLDALYSVCCTFALSALLRVTLVLSMTLLCKYAHSVLSSYICHCSHISCSHCHWCHVCIICLGHYCTYTPLIGWCLCLVLLSV